jgi:hypothetical protein
MDNAFVHARIASITASETEEGEVRARTLVLEPAASVGLGKPAMTPPGLSLCQHGTGAVLTITLPESACRGLDVGRWVRLRFEDVDDALAADLDRDRREALRVARDAAPMGGMYGGYPVQMPRR